MDDKNFGIAVNLIEQFAQVPADDSRIRERLENIMREMTDEQVTALVRYQAQMVKQQEQRLERLRHHLQQAQAAYANRPPKN